MAQRIPGPDPPAGNLTPDDVRIWLRVVYLEFPEMEVYSARRRDTLEILTPNVAPDPFELLSFAEEILGRRSRARLWLLTWARAEARRYAIARNAARVPAGGTVADFCAEFGIRRRTFDRTVDRACRVLAAEWNRRAASQLPKAG